jgi:hypothetical protein
MVEQQKKSLMMMIVMACQIEMMMAELIDTLVDA